MKRKLKVVALALTLTFVTTSCAASPTEEPAVSSFYPECDTDQVDLLKDLVDERWNTFAYDCKTDRQKPEAQLSLNPPSNDLDSCMLVETSAGRKKYKDNTTGFPRSENKSRLPDGRHKIVVIPIQWPDLRGEPSEILNLKPAAKKVDDWYSIYSRGKVSFEWEFVDQWLTLPDNSTNYSQSEGQQNTDQWGEENTNIISYFWKNALETSDSVVDFTDVDMVFFVLPKEQNVLAEFNLWPPGSGTYQTDEGPINRGFVPGSFHFQNGNEVWMFWIHEMLHYFKLPDLYWTDQNSVKHTAQTLPGPIQGFDILSNQGGLTKSLNGWLMWLAGWADAQEIFCLTPENFQPTSFRLSPIHKTDKNLKSVILKLSKTSAVVIESRRQNQFDDTGSQRSRDGVLVYHVDTSIGHGSGPLTLLAPAGRTLIEAYSGRQNQASLDAVLYEGNSMDIAGYHITVNEASPTGDVVSISQLDSWRSGDAVTYVCHTKKNRDQSLSYSESCPIKY